ncbi:MAG TPA: spermidine/putrescine ABC transporter substrate-binding protein [Planctomycetota bacterium]|nr:spermidine/putrescine ABC transporter substrate-binding protein [Planctomycetota bacterium]
MNRLALAFLLCFAGCSPAKPELHVFNWADYFAPDTLKNFEKEFDCRVVPDYFESAETLRARLDGGKSGFDVVFPSDEVMRVFIAKGLLDKLDPAKLPNLKNIAAKFRGLEYDPKNEYSVPYMWGTTGLAYNKSKVNPAPDSWSTLWDPKFAGHVTILDDAREAFAAAMWAEGGSPFTLTPDGVEKARKKLGAAKVLAFDGQPKTRLVKGEAWIAQCYSGDALQAAGAPAKERSGEIGYVIPKEGGTIWVDNICIPKGAPNRELAHKFIDYLLRADVSAAISNEVSYANPNEAAQKLISKEILDNRAANPTDDELKRCSLFMELAPELKKTLDDAWAQVKGK